MKLFENYVHNVRSAPHNLLHNFSKVEGFFQLFHQSRVFAKPRILKLRVSKPSFQDLKFPVIPTACDSMRRRKRV